MEQINAALDSRRYREAVNGDIRRARSLGIQGVPFFVIENRWGISGAQPSELFSQALDQAWRETQPLVMVQSEGAATGGGADGGNAGACGPDGCAI